jgi:hypothetical protein
MYGDAETDRLVPVALGFGVSKSNGPLVDVRLVKVMPINCRKLASSNHNEIIGCGCGVLALARRSVPTAQALVLFVLVW